MAEIVLAGLPASVLLQIASAFGLRPNGIAPIVNITEKTMARRLDGKAKLKPDESERAVRMMRAFSKAMVVLRDEDRVRGWLNSPLAVLDGKTPISLLASEPGAREVEQVLGRLENGVFS